MKKILQLAAFCAVMLFPVLTIAQVTNPPKPDSLAVKSDSARLMADTTAPKVDTVRVVVDTIVKKDCYGEYYDLMRKKGAAKVTDGMQPVVIALKGPNGCNCFLGQIEVVGGRMKAPLFFQAENGEYRPVTTLGKKLDAPFAASMTVEELYSIKDGMSIVFRTTEQEYGRLFFYTFANKGGMANKAAPSAAELIKD